MSSLEIRLVTVEGVEISLRGCKERSERFQILTPKVPVHTKISGKPEEPEGVVCSSLLKKREFTGSNKVFVCLNHQL